MHSRVTSPSRDETRTENEHTRAQQQRILAAVRVIFACIFSDIYSHAQKIQKRHKTRVVFCTFLSEKILSATKLSSFR